MDVDARLEALTIENERLRDELQALRDTLSDTMVVYPVQWGLTGTEARVLSTLLAREACTKEQIMAALYSMGADDEPHIKIIDVFVCKLRKKVRPYGIEIETIWGQGYRMTAAAKERTRALLDGAGAVAA